MRSTAFRTTLARFVLGIAAVTLVSSCGKKEEPAAARDTTVHASAEQIRIMPTGDTVYPNVKLTIVSPREGQVFPNAKDSIRVVMLVNGLDLAKPTSGDSAKGIAYSKQGQHVHVIVDDKPYMADYVNGQPFNVGVLTPGRHTIRAFPSFSWHESIKSPNAFATKTFFVDVKPTQLPPAQNNLLGPLLTYSRPKGTYSGAEANKVLLDFYFSPGAAGQAKLGPNDYKVRVWVDGAEQPPIETWQSYYIEGLAKGKHTVRLQLVDPHGNPVPGSYNNPTGEFTVE